MIKIITIAACLTLTALLHAQTTIRVTPNGSGNGTSWANTCNLETAVKTAISGDQIWVQKGIHYPSKMLVVPAVEDFSHLDKAMGGNGDGTGPSPDGTSGTDTYGKYYFNNTVRNNYLNTWNSGYYGGYCHADGVLAGQGAHETFWAQLEHNAEFGFRSDFRSNGRICPYGYINKFYGFTLRCVK